MTFRSGRAGMGLFSSSKAPPKPSKQPDVVRMMTGRATYEEAAIEHVLREQQAQQLNALEQERKAVNAVADRERQIMGKLAQVKAQLTETADELERSRKAEADLHKALRLAAERLAAATSQEDGLRAELEDSKASLVDARRQIQHLEARLYGEKGIKLGALQGANHGGPPPAHLQPPRAPAKDEEVITSLVTGAVPAAKDAASIGEERATATRQAREQLKRLLQFVTKQLSDDLGKWRGFGDAPPPEVTNSIGNQRALLSKLESALHELMDPLERSRSAQQARAAPFGAGDGVGFSVRVHGDMLPRSVAVNDSTIRPILLASGPAVRWVLRQHDAPPDTPNTQALKAKRRAAVAAGAEVEEEQIDWVAGETLMMVIEAVDDSGTVDVDFDAVVLLDCEAHVEGRGLVKVAKGRGFVPLVTTKSGEVTLELRDGGFTTMEPPPPIRVDFKGGPPAMIVFTPERQEEMAGEGIGVSVEARDRFDNVSTDVEGLEVQLAATHGATWGDEPVKLEAGEAQIDLVSEQAGTITLSCVGVTGDKAEMFPEHGLSNVAHLRYTPGNAACVQLSLLPDSFGAERIAGQRTKLRNGRRQERQPGRVVEPGGRPQGRRGPHWQRERRARWLVLDRRRRGGGVGVLGDGQGADPILDHLQRGGRHGGWARDPPHRRRALRGDVDRGRHRAVRPLLALGPARPRGRRGEDDRGRTHRGRLRQPSVGLRRSRARGVALAPRPLHAGARQGADC